MTTGLSSTPKLEDKESLHRQTNAEAMFNLAIRKAPASSKLSAKIETMKSLTKQLTALPNYREDHANQSKIITKIQKILAENPETVLAPIQSQLVVSLPHANVDQAAHSIFEEPVYLKGMRKTQSILNFFIKKKKKKRFAHQSRDVCVPDSSPKAHVCGKQRPNILFLCQAQRRSARGQSLARV